MAETWKPVVGYEDRYFVSDQGRVKSIRSGILLRHSMVGSQRGYRAVKLYRAGEGINHRVHRLVLEAFVGPMPDGLETRHINGDSCDNRLENLKYGTRAENIKDKVAHGTDVGNRGSAHVGSRLTESDVVELRQRYASGGITQRKLAEEYGVNQSTVHRIISGQKWSHVQ